ncbi:hypothetical protein [Mesorhizobium sp.]|jgi:hypothetical protein|uniref:hypothetical protein n=1 Tax=Mesorhizobium sp. TaxID=1871066 RepID=UPI000FE90D4C|nr:hypothetical protein [Mesorhizobium sp.]RWQ60295.1 MAG: hypothetical protein EOS83_07370 [Mesorhizobium sp.]
MGILHLDAEAKAELHSEAVKLIAWYDSPLETVKALMAYNCELETKILAMVYRHPGVATVSYDDTPVMLG